MSRKSRSRKDLSWLDIADFLQLFTRSLNTLTEMSYRLTHPVTEQERQRAEWHAQRLENMRLDAEAKLHRGRKLSNEVTMTDIRAELEERERLAKLEKVELENLEKRLKLKAAGAFNDDFQAASYADPGDVRHGKLYKQ